MAIEITSFTDLDAVAADAAGALDRGSQASLFDRLDWYRLLTAHCAIPGEMLIVRARDDHGAVWLFLSRQGRQAVSLANWYTFASGPVSAGTPHSALFEALARHLRTNERIAALVLSPLNTDRLDKVVDPFRSAGWIGIARPTTVNWICAPRSKSWDAYLQARPTRVQNTVRRKSRAADIKIEIIDVFSYDKWNTYEHIYSLSWKQAEGSPAFLRALAEQESAAGTLRLGLAFDGDEAIAAQFWLVENGKATVHKLAHVEARRSESPGTLLTAAMFRHVIEQDAVHQIDFGTGDDGYKADWMDERRPLYSLHLFNPSTAHGLFGAARESLSVARARIRRA